MHPMNIILCFGYGHPGQSLQRFRLVNRGMEAHAQLRYRMYKYCEETHFLFVCSRTFKEKRDTNFSEVVKSMKRRKCCQRFIPRLS